MNNDREIQEKKSMLIKYHLSAQQVLQDVAQPCSQDLSLGFWAWWWGQKIKKKKKKQEEFGPYREQNVSISTFKDGAY